LRLRKKASEGLSVGNWEHMVALEGILLADPYVAYPRCLDGARRGPPEDCGTFIPEEFAPEAA
jgi:hypothetical protein